MNLGSTDKETFAVELTRADALRLVDGLRLLRREAVMRTEANRRSGDPFLNTTGVEVGMTDQTSIQELIGQIDTARVDFDQMPAAEPPANRFAVTTGDLGTAEVEGIDWLHAAIKAFDEWGYPGMTLCNYRWIGAGVVARVYDSEVESEREGIDVMVVALPDRRDG